MVAPEFTRWFRDNGDQTRLLDHNLDEESIVFDVGGYTGEFANDIVNKFNCNVYVFEPVKKFYTQLVDCFGQNEKVIPLNYGLAPEDTELYINIDEDNGENTTLLEREVIKNGTAEKIFLKSIENFLVEQDIDRIDLISINIEGGEYALLEYLVTSPTILKIKNIQVQFHDFVDNAQVKRDILHIKLQNTHKLTYNYDFVWENWGLRG